MAGKKIISPNILSNGFTLIEMIIVIVVLGVLSVGTVSFITLSTQGYIDAEERQRLGQNTFIVTEKLNRYFREALPNSLRLGSASGATCAEWIPILASGLYTDAPVVAPGAAITVAENLSGTFQVGYLAIYPVPSDVNELYQVSTDTAITSVTVSQSDPVPADSLVQLDLNAGTHQFPGDSPQRRFFIASQPNMLCIDGTRLFIYQNYGFQSTISASIAARPTSVPNRQLIGNGLDSGVSSFSYSPGTEQINAILTAQIGFSISEGGPQVVTQEVHIRNVP